MARQTTTHTPCVSIGLPVFNGADYLDEAIRSIREQSFADFELIICDNASSDGTREICEFHAGQDDRIRYICHAENIGAAANYDHSFHVSEGKYFKWAAHDDVLEPGYLEACVKVLEEDPHCALVYPTTVLTDQDGKPFSIFEDYLACEHEDPVERLANWIRKPLTAMCNPVFGVIRKDVMARTGLHGYYIASDHVFLAEIALLGTVRHVDEELFLRRVHDQMSTEAHIDSVSLVWWYTGKKRQGLWFKYWRLFGEHLKMPFRLELSHAVRWRSLPVLLDWGMRHRKLLMRELMLPLFANGEPTRLSKWLKHRKSADFSALPSNHP